MTVSEHSYSAYSRYDEAGGSPPPEAPSYLEQLADVSAVARCLFPLPPLPLAHTNAELRTATTTTTTTTTVVDVGADKKTRKTWKSMIGKDVKNADGERRVVYTFLQASNTRDLLFVRQLLESKPWKCKYKEVGIKWREFTDNLVKVVDADGSLLFEGLQSRAVQNRFKELIKFAAARSKENAIKTGEDNADEPGEIEVSLLKIYEEYEVFRNLAEENQVTPTKKKEADLLAAKSIMNASLHRYVSKIGDAEDAG
jgi:hypothetical protein